MLHCQSHRNNHIALFAAHKLKTRGLILSFFGVPIAAKSIFYVMNIAKGEWRRCINIQKDGL